LFGLTRDTQKRMGLPFMSNLDLDIEPSLMPLELNAATSVSLPRYRTNCP
jgi:hypothetical protein